MKYQSIKHYLEDLKVTLDRFDFWGEGTIVVEFHSDRILVDANRTVASQQRRVKNFVARLDSAAGNYA